LSTHAIDGVRNFDKSRKGWDPQIPNLLEIQLQSFQDFLQADIPPEKRKKTGLQEVFENVFPIKDANDLYSLEFVKYELGEPKYSIEECEERDLTHAVPLKATLRLRIREEVEGEKREKEIIEQEVYLGELPVMTPKGTFIINGAERVVVSQLHRSPGVSFDETTHPNGKKLFGARVIPYRGSWVEFALDVNDIMYAYIDRKRKLPVTLLLKALDYESEKSILELFFDTELVDIGTRGAKKAEAALGMVSAEDVVDTRTGEVLLECNEEITEEHLDALWRAKIRQVKVFVIPLRDEADVIRNTLKKDGCKSTEQALIEICKVLRPGDPPKTEVAREILNRQFFNPRRYNLARVGRHKMNQKLQHEILLGGAKKMKSLGFTVPPEDAFTLTKEDIVAITKYVFLLRIGETLDGLVGTDDIDHLGNRRVRCVGELLSNQFNIALARMARIIRERMSMHDADTITPYDLVNARTVSTVVQSFFASSQLSQFMDQTNPLAELTHKRRLSALGPGGLSRERAGFEVRDVHHTHYGRICPIETPEGPNIGLISSLSSCARVNEFGFLESPYRRVRNGVVKRDDIVYLSADLEDRYRIAQQNVPVGPDGKLQVDRVTVRHRGDFPQVGSEDVDFMDVAPLQLVSVAAALIPFLEHDDANRALMGSNMQRQAVPLLKTEPPLVMTGLEERVARDSQAIVVARHAGVVESVSADEIVIRYGPRTGDGLPVDLSKEPGFDVYRLTKFKRSNQDTCINQRPIVTEGQKVEKGEVIADGAATSGGKLALGADVLVAFMPWGGYNFEDAILVSDKLIKEDKFRSVHIEEFEIQVRDTKRGVEEITREIPNVSEDAVKDLDENGIVRIGARVKAGDILVGKVTPKPETDLAPEERLLRAIFGDKAGDVRDASLKAPPGMDGIVIDTKVFSRKVRDETTRKEEKRKLDRLKRKARAEREAILKTRDDALKEILVGQKTERIISSTGRLLQRAGKKITEKLLEGIDFDELEFGCPITKSESVNNKVWAHVEAAGEAVEKVNRELEKEIEKLTRGDELPPGVIKLVKVYVAKNRRLSVGDKMAGRHGNKGVVAKILPEHEMPYLPDGTPVDIVLNPLGVPSRMNLGQILETHLGWAAHKLGYRVVTPVFSGAHVEEVKAALREAGLPEDGKSTLYDGRTGEPFDQRVAVGYIYVMKLSHLVDDKIHARSIGPYSLVTQQPLGGKAQFGGQRFGEMEVWALEAYGAAYTLQEMLTVKSDDVAGRSRVYEAIVKGENPPEPGVPESFNVLVKELQSLCLDLQFDEQS